MVRPLSPSLSPVAPSSSSSPSGDAANVANSNHNSDDEEGIIDLTSGSDEDDNLSSSSVASCSPPATPSLVPNEDVKQEQVRGEDVEEEEDEEEDDLELQFVEDLQSIQRSLRAKVNEFGRRVKRKRRLNQQQQQLSLLDGHNQNPVQIVTGQGDGNGPRPSQSSSSQNHQSTQTELQLSPSQLLASSSSDFQQPVRKVEHDELKRKLDMVTAELSRSRGELVKKMRRAIVPMVIKVPDFPMEYYNVNANWEENDAISEEYTQWVQNRTKDFLPEVLKIMFTSWNQKSFPSAQLQGSDLLNCRRVNKSWNHIVDKFLQEYTPSQDTATLVSTKFYSKNHKQVGAMSFSTLKTYKHEESSHPFPSRSIVIKPHPLENKMHAMTFKTGLNTILNCFGGDVHHLAYVGEYQDSINFFDGTGFAINSWITLKIWLEKMPNLKTIHISMPYSADAALEEGLVDSSIMATNPFPRLPKLTVLGARHVPSILLESILHGNRSIKTLSVYQLSGERQLDWAGYSRQLIDLSEFSGNILKMSHVQPLGQVKWPLRKLSLSSFGTSEELINLAALFKILETFQATLKELGLNVWITTCSERNLSLRLPHLEQFTIFLMENSVEERISYDFLLPLISLQNFDITLEREYNPNAESSGGGGGKGLVEVIELQGYINHLYDSNIWSLLPNLKKVKATTTTCYEGYGLPGREYCYTRDKLAK